MSADFEVKSNVKNVLNELDDAVETALETVGIKAEGLAKLELERSPRRVDTGLLRNSITHAVGGKPTAISSYSGDKPSQYTGKEATPGHYSGTAPSDGPHTNTVYIGTNVSYAEYVHEGSTSMSPNRFLKNALQGNVSEYKRILINFLNH